MNNEDPYLKANREAFGMGPDLLTRYRSLEAENERLRAERDALAGASEAYRVALVDGHYTYIDMVNGTESCEPDCPACAALANPLPHHAERVRLERAVVEAARAVDQEAEMDVSNWEHPFHRLRGVAAIGDLHEALAALDAHGKEKRDEAQ